jgi:cysteine desulfurase / selenocysteine lyase
MDQAIRDLFPVVRSKTYLNSAAIGPMPMTSVSAVAAQLDDVATGGAIHLSDWVETKNRVRCVVAEMLGVRSDDVAFTRNTSDGLCAVAAGLDWDPGDNIVSFANEFPANYYPWKKVSEDHNVELRLCPERDGRIDLDEFCGLIDGRTRLVSVSAVQYLSGFRVDLERVGRIARKHGALFCVDIIQAFGAMPLDLPTQFVDIAAGSSYKWLCSPEGCGIFYLGERARSRVRPTSRGWTSVEHAWDFDNHEQPLVTDSRAWETGMGGSALFYGLEQSLQLLRNTGVRWIEKYLGELTDHLCELVPSKKYRIASSRAPGERSQVVSLVPLNGTGAADIVDRLALDNVVVSARGNTIRIAPHFFNNFEDIETAAASLN